MKVKALKAFLHLGSMVKVGAVFAVPAEISRDTAFAWVQAELAEFLPKAKAKPKKVEK